jgi:glycosyltransferase involved in cell wall biosynthesis
MTQRSRDRRDMRRAAPTKPGSARSQGGARTVATVRELLRSSPFGVGQIDFSVVIPAHNRPRQLIECLAAISVLAYPVSRYEVIVVDDGSDESMEPAVAPFLGRMNIALLRQSNSGPAKARNAGAAAARGKYVAFTDDDCRPDPCWLAALAKSVAANPGCAVGGQTITLGAVCVSPLESGQGRCLLHRLKQPGFSARVLHRDKRLRHPLSAGGRRRPRTVRPLAMAGWPHCVCAGCNHSSFPRAKPEDVPRTAL